MTVGHLRSRLRAGFIAAPLLALCALGLRAWADDEQVLQIKQSFEPKVLALSAGAKVTFLNADDVDHNLHLVAPDAPETDYGVQKPGQSRVIAFGGPGQYRVVCSIHPKMKLKVTVR
jgi:plastocyanin